MGQALRPWKTVISLDLDSGPPIYQQVADALIDEIKKGRLKPGTPLPGTRQLAEDLGVNRKNDRECHRRPRSRRMAYQRL